MSAMQGIQSGIQKNKEIETAKASIKAKKKQLENQIDMRAIDQQARQLLEQQSGGDVHFGEVDFQLVKQRLLQQAMTDAKTKAEQYEQEALSQLDQNAGMNQITDSITGFAQSGIGMLAQGFGNKNNTTPTTPSSTTLGTSVTTNNSIFQNNSMFSPSNYNNPNYVNNFWNMKKPSTN